MILNWKIQRSSLLYKFREFSFIYLVLICTLSLNKIYADEGKEIHIENIKLDLIDGHLTISAQCKNLFSRKCTSTIQSGLRSEIHIDIQLCKSEGKSIYETTQILSIQYDTWDERYTILLEDTTIILTELDAVKQVVNQIQNKEIIQSLMKPSNDYLVKIRVEIDPIAQEHMDEMTEYLVNPNQMGKNLPSEKKSDGFRINVNKIVARIIGGKKLSQNCSEWYSSKSFTISESGNILQ